MPEKSTQPSIQSQAGSDHDPHLIEEPCNTHTVIASWVQAVASTIEGLGVDTDAVFDGLDIDISPSANAGARIPHSQTRIMWKRIGELTNDPNIPLKIARYMRPVTLQALGFALYASATVEDAIRTLSIHFNYLSTGLSGGVEHHGDQLALWMQGHHCVMPAAMDGAAAAILNTLRVIHSGELNPVRVGLCSSEPADTREHEEYFRAPLSFDAQRIEMVFDTVPMRTPLQGANIELKQMAERMVVDYMANMHMASTSALTQQAIVKSLSRGAVSEQEIADALHISPRHLQRRLQEEGITFTRLLDETRSELSSQYIRDTNLSVSEISHLVGFSDLSVFSRAFKRWTGLSPSEWRRQNLS